MPEITLAPISDIYTTGFVHSGLGGFWEDVDDDPDSPDSAKIQEEEGGSSLKTLSLGLSSMDVESIESIVCRINFQTSGTILKEIKVSGAGAGYFVAVPEATSAGGVSEFTLTPIMTVPATLTSTVYCELTVQNITDDVFIIEAIEFIVNTADGGGGGGNPPGPGGQLSQNASWFQQICGL